MVESENAERPTKVRKLKKPECPKGDIKTQDRTLYVVSSVPPDLGIPSVVLYTTGWLSNSFIAVVNVILHSQTLADRLCLFDSLIILPYIDCAIACEVDAVQESCAIAKMTAQCALHMGALKIFGTP